MSVGVELHVYGFSGWMSRKGRSRRSSLEFMADEEQYY
jgi:hypothetical protein